MSQPQPDPRYAILDLSTGEVIDLATFAREHIDPQRQREILRQAVRQVTGQPTLPQPGDALANYFFAGREEID